MDDIITDAEIRLEKARHRAQGPCCTCPESYPGAIEQHHIAGIALDGETVPVCRNCHRKLSDVQLDHPDLLGSPHSPLEIIGHYLLGLADILGLVAERLKEFGGTLIDLAAASLIEAEAAS